MLLVNHSNDGIGGANACHDLLVENVLLDEQAQELAANKDAGEDYTRLDRLPSKISLLHLGSILDKINKAENYERCHEIEEGSGDASKKLDHNVAQKGIEGCHHKRVLLSNTLVP